MSRDLTRYEGCCGTCADYVIFVLINKNEGCFSNQIKSNRNIECMIVRMELVVRGERECCVIRFIHASSICQNYRQYRLVNAALFLYRIYMLSKESTLLS